jgi:DNA-binding transcriptional LysR family regulator
MHSFALPVSTPEFTVSLLWHPRLDADLAHRWLRGHVRQICAAIRLTGTGCHRQRMMQWIESC